MMEKTVKRFTALMLCLTFVLFSSISASAFEINSNKMTLFGVDFEINSGADYKNSKNYYSESQLKALLYSEAKLVEKTYDNLKGIALDISSENVIVTKGGDKFKVSLYQWTDNEYQFIEKENVLLVTQSRDKIMGKYDSKLNFTQAQSLTYDWVNTLLQKNNIKPDPKNPIANHRTVYVNIPEKAQMEGIICDTTSGNVSISGLNFNVVLADTTSGNITISKVTSNDIVADSTSGNITVDGCNAETIVCDSTDGIIKVTGSSSKDVVLGSTDGNIELNNVKDVNGLVCDTTNGNIKLKGCTVKELLIDTTDGKTEIYGGSVKNINADTTSGSVNVKNVSGIVTFLMETTSGNANINLMESADNYNILFEGQSSAKAVINGKTYSGEAAINQGKNKIILFDSTSGSLTVTGN